MNVSVYESGAELGAAAAALAADRIAAALARRGEANIVLATGASQFATLAALVELDVDWSCITMFHLDEYLGLPADHPAGFRAYLRERFIDRVRGLRAAHLIDGEAADPARECARLGALIARRPIDVALIGIGENGHLAFNDPPADFETEEPFLTVTLDEACRRQQVGEGWFAALNDVPARAITMSVRQIMKSAALVVSMPDRRKADAVRAAVEGPVVPECPASILQRHPDCHLLLDTESALLLARKS